VLSNEAPRVARPDETQAKERRAEKTRRPRGKDKDKPAEKAADDQ